jgi:predicted amidophosphoribosyltransferase
MTQIFDSLEMKRCFGCNAKGLYFCTKCIAGFNPGSRLLSKGLTLTTVSQHNPAMMRAISGWKDRHLKGLTLRFADLLTDQQGLLGGFDRVQILTPPSRKNSFSKRGFNPVSDLAAELTRRNPKFVFDIAATNFNWQPKDQRGLDLHLRRTNLVGAMRVSPRPNLPSLFLDDVWTSGSTIRELVRALPLESEVVGIWVLATAYKLGTKDSWKIAKP